MGLTPGTKIKVVKVAPMDGPVEVAVRGSKLALGQDIACNVVVEVEKTNLGGRKYVVPFWFKFKVKGSMAENADA